MHHPVRERIVSALLLCLLSIALFSAKPCYADDSAIEVAEKVISAIETYRDRLRLDAIGKMTFRSADESVASSSKIKVKIRAASERMLLSIAKLDDSDSSLAAKGIQTDFVVYPSGEVLLSQARISDQFRQQSQYTQRDALRLWSMDIAGTQTVHSDNVIVKLGESAVLLWWVGRAPLELYLSEADSMEWDGRRLVALSPFGRLELATSVADNWLPSSFRVRKSQGDQCLVGTVANWGQPFKRSDDAGSAEEIIPAGASAEPASPVIESILWAGKTGGLATASQGAYAREIVCTATFEYTNQPQETLITKHEITEFTVQPTFKLGDLSTELEFPVGAEVNIADALHLPFHWDGAKPVPGSSTVRPKLPEPEFPLADRNRFTLLLTVNFILIVVAIGYVILRSRTQSRGSK